MTKPQRKHYKPGTMVCVRTLKCGRVEVVVTEPAERKSEHTAVYSRDAVTARK